MKTSEAIERVKAGDNLKGVVLEDISTVQVTVTDALLLSKGGIVVPESNVYYDDESIEYDEDIDEVVWSEDYVEMSWEEKEQFFSTDDVSLDIKVDDVNLKKWLTANGSRVSELILPVIKGLYQMDKKLAEE